VSSTERKDIDTERKDIDIEGIDNKDIEDE
jgi:hypothetical protein